MVDDEGHIRAAGITGSSRHRRGWLVVAALGSVVCGAGLLAVGLPHSAESAAIPTVPSVSRSAVSPASSPQVAGTVAASTTTTTVAAAATQLSAPPTTAAAPTPTVAAMVDQAEAAGLQPGPDWTWAMGDTSAQCGATTANVDMATGCTYWASGVERTIFEGSPSLALVAHEVANAETEHDAVSTLLADVASAEAGSSWSPTDAVASCLVEHFLGFQDGSAGSWQCPSALAASVAAQMHQTVSVTQMTATCGTATGATSTLTFTGSAGTLKVTAPSAGSAQVADAGVPVTVSGVGVFTAVDTGGTISQSGACTA